MLTDKQVFLHIGVPKTGTSALQQNFFSQCPGIHYLGKPQTAIFKRVAELILSITEHDTLEWDAGLDALRARVAPLFRTEEDRVLISEEEFSAGSLCGRANRTAIAQRLHLLFPQARVLLMIRNQLTALPSLYAYAMTLSGTRYVPFNAWLEDLRAALPYGRGFQLFDFDDLIGLYARLFGREQIEVFFYEDFRTRYPAFITRLARTLGVDEKVALSLQARDTNVRPSLRQVQALKLRERQPWIARTIEALPSLARRKLTDAVANGPPLDVGYSMDNEAFVRAYYATSNRRLVEVHGVDVRSLGYTL